MLPSAKNTKIVLFFIFAFQDLQNLVLCLLIKMFFFYIKFANFWYITCSDPCLIPIWSWVYGLTWKTEYSKSSNIYYVLMIVNQNILAILRAFLILQKSFTKNSTPSKPPQLLLLNFLAKFLTERKYLMNTLIFVRQKYL